MHYYPAITIRAYGDRSYPEYYPQIDEKGYFIPEPGESAAVSASFTNLQVSQNSKIIFESEHGLDGKLFITDTRIVLMCDDYESGQFLWAGNPLITVIASAASSAAAKSRTVGKVLTGHVRYEWLKDIVSTSEKLLFSLTDETIVVNYQDPFDATCSLVISLKNVSGIASKIDAEIQRRIAKHKTQPLSGEDGQHKLGLPAAGRGEPSNYAYCSECGKRSRESDKYCRNCGTKAIK